MRSREAMHQSHTCFVYEGQDEGCEDEDGQSLPPMSVALKFMMVKSQFLREVNSRGNNFDPKYVCDIIRCHPHVTSAMELQEQYQILDSLPDFIDLQNSRNTVVDGEIEARRGLRKEDAEKLCLLVMPLQERNLFVAMKQERFAGKDHETIKHVSRSIINSIVHMHERRVLHGDLKPLNIMRKDGNWGLIDLDTAARIGVDHVGFKSSSAYVPPEGVYVNADRTIAAVRSPTSHEEYGDECEVLIASESYDVWSFGCIFYQLVNTGVLPLWQCNQDDNLSNVASHVDSLFDLFDFTDELKIRKLELIEDPLARNLAAQMLTKDPKKRPTFSRVLAHPFLSGRAVVRLAGNKPKFHFFLSYRVASDAAHVELLYEQLTAKGRVHCVVG